MAYTLPNLKVSKRAVSDLQAKADTLRYQLATVETDLSRAQKQLNLAVFARKASSRRLRRRSALGDVAVSVVYMIRVK